MSSPTLNQIAFVVDPVSETKSQTRSGKPVEPGAEIGLTTRAVLAVTVLGAGMWYLLWKVALYFEAAR
jgi:hypothetical protein